VPAILRTLSHSELGVTPLETAATQGQLKPAELAEAIRKLPAVVVVTRIGKPAVGPLVRMFKDPNPYLRLAAIVAVGDIGPDAKDAIPLWAASRCRAGPGLGPILARLRPE
jgi:HEAT repeat protein